MKYLLYIKATTDTTSISSLNKISETDIPVLEKILSVIKLKGCKWPRNEFDEGEVYNTYKDTLTEEEIEFFDDLTPENEDWGEAISTIVEAKILKVSDEITLI